MNTIALWVVAIAVLINTLTLAQQVRIFWRMNKEFEKLRLELIELMAGMRAAGRTAKEDAKSWLRVAMEESLAEIRSKYRHDA